MAFTRSIRLAIILILMLVMLQTTNVLAIPVTYDPPLPTAPVTFLVHTATAANTDGSVTYIDHTALNAHSSLYVFVMQNWNPPGSTGVYNSAPVGVWYSSIGPTDPSRQNRWAIVNQNGANIPLGASFNVMFLSTDANVFLHTTSSADTTRPYTILDDPAINNDPNAILMLTYYEGIGGPPPGTTLFNHNLGIAYNTDTGRWWVVTEDNANWVENRNIMVFDVSQFENNTFLHTVPANVASNYTWFIDPASDNRHSSLVFATHYLGQYPAGGWVYDNHPLGVWYMHGVTPRWSIFNQDYTAMSLDMFFHIIIIPAEFSYLPLVVK